MNVVFIGTGIALGQGSFPGEAVVEKLLETFSRIDLCNSC
jgi:hypothetical protein